MIILKENGQEKVYDVLMEFETEKQNYVVYTDNVLDVDGYKKVYAGILDEEKKMLLPVKGEEKWCLIDKMLSNLDGK